MTFDWVTLVNDIGIILAIVGGLFGLNKKFPFITKSAQFLENNAVTIGKGIETIVEDIAKTPAGAVIEHQLHKQVDQVTEQLKQSELLKYVLIGLHSYNVTAANLSETQKQALAKFVIDSIPANWNITQDDVIKTLNEAENAVSAFENLDIVKAANYFTNAQKEPVQVSATPNQQAQTEQK